MQLEPFKMFCDEVEQGSFSHAARRSQVTQGAVSQGVHARETRDAAPLWSRNAAAPTPPGEQLARGVNAVLAQFSGQESPLRPTAPTARRTTLSTTYSVSLQELGDIQRRVRPAAALSLRHRCSEEVYADVLLGAAELGLVSYPQQRGEVEVIPFRADPLVAVLPPAHVLAGAREVSLAELAALPFIAFARETPCGAGIERIFFDQGLQLTPTVQACNVETIKRAVECGLGVSVLPLPTVEHELSTGTLVARPLAKGRWTRPIGLLICKGRYLDRAAQAVIEAFLSRPVPSNRRTTE